MTPLHLLPSRTAGAAENMAVDFLLLQRYPVPVPRFRHYDWRSAAFTFGFGQKIEFVRANLPVGEPLDLCRRPTGGGIVDHRDDWTYALVLPRGHALYDERAAQSYRVVHDCLATAMRSLGEPAELKLVCDPAAPCASDSAGDPSGGIARNPAPAALPGICFQRAELHDVINRDTGRKIAGAAQKRNKHGLLFQGSIEKSSVRPVDWDEFQIRFTAALARALVADAVETPWPDLNEDEVTGLIGQYSDPQWIECR